MKRQVDLAEGTPKPEWYGEHSKLSMTPERIEILKANAYKGRETMRRLLETIMGPLSRPRSKILRVAVSRIILSSEASKVKLVGNLVA